MKKLLAALAFLAFSPLASAVTSTVDFSDMWWNPNESGWGANVIQQGDNIFVTFFVYDQNGKPTWFVGPNTANAGLVNGKQRFSGQLFSTTGPYFGGASFNASGVVSTQVGTVTIDFSDNSDATITYGVNGVNVTKSIQRQSWATENLAGSYRGGDVGQYTTCPGTTNIDNPVTLTITQIATRVTINEFGTQNGQTYSCVYSGDLAQTGKVASITGTETCSDNTVQTFTASNVVAGKDFVSMTIDSAITTCRFHGRLGGIRNQ